MIEIKTRDEIERMREAGRLCALCMEEILKAVEPGVTTWDLDKIAYDYTVKAGGFPSFKNYRGFPGSICASVNDEVVHGIPGARKLNEGDIISIDMGVLLHGYHSDMARTVGVGKISESAKKLIETTKNSFFAGMENAKEGNRLNDVSSNIEFVVRAAGYGIVKELVGHGIGRNLHEEPDIPNFSIRRRGPRLRKGMVLAIEPMVNIGSGDVIWMDDGWTVKTSDGSLSAHYENTVAITSNGPEILTTV